MSSPRPQRTLGANVKTEPFLIRLEGRGCVMPAEDGAVNVGFLATRIEWAPNAVEARSQAMRQIEADLDERTISRTGDFVVSVEDCDRIGWLRALWRKPAGFTFFEE